MRLLRASLCLALLALATVSVDGVQLRGRFSSGTQAASPGGVCDAANIAAGGSNCPLLTQEQIFGSLAGGFCPPTSPNGGTYLGAQPNWSFGIDPITGYFILGANDNMGQRAWGKIVPPALTTQTNAGLLNVASWSQSIIEPTEGYYVDNSRGVYHGNFAESVNTVPTAIVVYQDGSNNTRILGTNQYYYTNGSPDIYPFFTRPWDFTDTGHVNGMDKIPAASPYDSFWTPRMSQSYCGNVPPEWQTALGGSVWCGNGGTQSIITTQSYGPSFFTLNPNNVGNGTGSSTSNMLLAYPSGHETLGGWDSYVNGEMFEISTQPTGGAMIGGTRTALTYGSMGTSAACYGVGVALDDPLVNTPYPDPVNGPYSHCPDPARSGEGQHAYPYVYRVWAYDMNDFKKVKDGTTNPGTGQPWKPWDVVPYGFWSITYPVPRTNLGDDVLTRGMQYDQTHHIMWTTQSAAGCVGGGVQSTFWGFNVSGTNQ